MSVTLDYLKNQYYICDTEIKELNKEKKRLEDAHDSLQCFKGDVLNSRGAFSEAISARKAFLSSLDQAQEHNKPIRLYREGMSNVLGGVGGKMVLRVFQWMEDRVSKELRGYKNKIKDIEGEINKKLARQEELLREIRTAEQLELESAGE